MLIVILNVAEAYGLPFLPASLNVTKSQADTKRGVNFAYGGSTALDSKYYFDRSGVDKPMTNNSLSVQFDWFKNLKPLLCKSKEGFSPTFLHIICVKFMDFFLYD